MNHSLNIGAASSGKPFCLPLDAVTQTFAILAIRGAGKTVTATVIAEEMCKAGLPWIAFDPVGVWRGLRSAPDGSPGGYPVVVIGGQRGDLPLEKLSGPKIAEALLTENVFAVIDLSQESKTTWRRFMTDFCLAMMDMNPATARHLFIEEAPEFCPQRTKVALTAECKEAIERLVRLGRNRGYGCTLISQRPATVDKDVLSQCENLFVLRTSGPHDRKALEEWISAQATEAGLEKFLGELAGLPSGTAFFWSPHWLRSFEKVRIRPRETFHPGATRTAGGEVKVATMSDVGAFVARLKTLLSKTTVPVQRPPVQIRAASPAPQTPQAAADMAVQNEVARLRQELDRERTGRADAERRLAAVKALVEPQYRALRMLFEAIGEAASAGAVNRAAYDPWLAKAGQRGCRRMLETLLDRPELTRPQLGTLAGCSFKSSTFRNYLSWLKRNGLIEATGDVVKLRAV
jgi:hypothetical protein